MAKTNNLTNKTFTISQLDEIEHLDGADSFLMTDYEGDKLYTKKLTLKKLLLNAAVDSDFAKILALNPKLILTLLDLDELDSSILTKVNSKVEEITTIDGGNSSEN